MMMLKAVAGEMIDHKGDDKKNGAQAGYLYPAGHFRRIELIHGAAVFVTAKLKSPRHMDFAKPGNIIAKPGNIITKPGILCRPGG